MVQSTENRVQRSTFGFRSPVVWALLAGVVVLLAGCTLAATSAAKTYTRQLTSYKTTAKASAQRANVINYASTIIAGPNVSQADQNQNEDAACADANSLLKTYQQKPTPQLRQNLFIGIGSLLSGSYRQARSTQKSDVTTTQQQVILTHLQRLAHACTVSGKDNTAQALDITNAAKRADLLANCPADSNGCTDSASLKQYAQLYLSVVALSKAETQVYQHNCAYPELSSMCQKLAVFWADNLKTSEAYYTALSTGGDYSSASTALGQAENKDAVATCKALEKSQPKLMARISQAVQGADCTDQTSSFKVFNEALVILATDDETAIRTASHKIV